MPPGELDRCSDLNTTRFLRRVIDAEKPDLIAFTGIVAFFLLLLLFAFFYAIVAIRAFPLCNAFWFIDKVESSTEKNHFAESFGY